MLKTLEEDIRSLRIEAADSRILVEGTNSFELSRLTKKSSRPSEILASEEYHLMEKLANL